MEEKNIDSYDVGAYAALNGAEFWENPHSDPRGSRNSFDRWFAGWCFGKNKLVEELAFKKNTGNIGK